MHFPPPPPKALHLLMFLSVSDFLAKLRTFLLPPTQKVHPGDQLWGQSVATNPLLIVLR